MKGGAVLRGLKTGGIRDARGQWEIGVINFPPEQEQTVTADTCGNTKDGEENLPAVLQMEG